MKIPALLAVFAFMLSGCATRSTVPDTDAGSKIADAVTAPLPPAPVVEPAQPATQSNGDAQPVEMSD